MNRNVTAVILIVLAIGVYFTVTKPVLGDISSLSAENAQYTSAISNAEQLIKLRDSVRADYNNVSPDDRARLDKMLPNTVDNIRLIIDLNSVALRHGFSLNGIKAVADSGKAAAAGAQQGSAISASSAAPASTIATPTLDTVTISFGVTAPYLQFISFMQDLEANLRIMDLTHLSVTASDSGTYNFSVQLKTYWLRQ